MPPLTKSATQPLLFDHYLVERVLGTGAMGVVYLARDQRIGRLVALKTLHQRSQVFDNDGDAQEFVHRFRREAQLCGSLVHPNIVTLYEVGQEGQRFTYLAMEYVEGESLLSLLRRKQRLQPEMAMRVADDVLQALGHAHDRGIIHRDIKPANILVSLTGQAKISDFGIAREARGNITDLTESGRLLGTPHYMAPEQIAGKEVDARADLFSVGVVLYEMLAGWKPFDGGGLTDVLYKVVNEPARPLDPSTPEWCASFVERLLAKTPDKRFPSAIAASRELRRLLREHADLVEMPEIDISIVREQSPEETPTTPIVASSVPRRRISLHRPISRIGSLALIGAICAITAGTIFTIAREIDDAPRAVIHPEQIAEFEQKRAALEQAALLLDAGAVEESARRYRTLVEKYPDNVPAREGLVRAEARLAELKSRPETVAAAVRGAKSLSDTITVKNDRRPERLSWWRRVWKKIRHSDS